MATITDKISRATDSSTDRPIIATLAAPGKTVGAPSVTLSSATNWTTATPVYVALYTTTAAGVKDPTSQTDWKAILTGTTLSNMTITGGVDRPYSAGAYVEITFTAGWAKDMYDWMAVHGNADGSLKTTAVQTALNLGAGSLNGWNALGFAPATVTANGNRSYDLVFTGQDLTGTLSAGMRLRTTRTVAAPTQCTSLNGTTQYYSKTSPASMTFTNNFVTGAWVKLNSYPTVGGTIIGRFSSSGSNNGWYLIVNSSGQVQLWGFSASTARYIQSYQSIPLNKWVHVVAQLDMTVTTNLATTNYVMIDGVDVPAQQLSAGGTPTALVQAGNLDIGTRTSAVAAQDFFPGKIAQAFVASAKITQANVRTLMSQGLTTALCTANNIVSAYSFNASTSDITVAANNLTSNGSAVATNADSPFGTQAGGSISSTLDYAIIQAATFSTNTTVTVSVPEGNAIPTSGGVASVVYSSAGKPYGMPTQRGKWTVESVAKVRYDAGSAATGVVVNPGSWQITMPTGSWRVLYEGSQYVNRGSVGVADVRVHLGTSAASLTGMLDNSRSNSYSYTSLDASVWLHKEFMQDISSQTILYLNVSPSGYTATNIGWLHDFSVGTIQAENAYL